MATVFAPGVSGSASRQEAQELGRVPAQIILSFDVEEHDRIEAAANLRVGPELQAHYRGRLDSSTRWLVDQLSAHAIKATFFFVADIARHSPALIRAVHDAGHEVASHGWDHRRLHHFTPAAFRSDVQQSRDALEQVTGAAVVGYRAPTFSLVRRTAWAVDVLSELGLLYDSSIYPVRHDRYGVPDAPRSPFWARGSREALLELPPVTLRVLGTNVPLGGGGYFRLLPLFLLERALLQMEDDCDPSVAMLYFHPWEFDPRQARLPLGVLNSFRTYVGIYRSQARLMSLLARQPKHLFVRAQDVAKRLSLSTLPTFDLT